MKHFEVKKILADNISMGVMKYSFTISYKMKTTLLMTTHCSASLIYLRLTRKFDIE